MKTAPGMSTNTMSRGLGQAEKLAVGEIYSIDNCYYDVDPGDIHGIKILCATHFLI